MKFTHSHLHLHLHLHTLFYLNHLGVINLGLIDLEFDKFTPPYRY